MTKAGRGALLLGILFLLPVVAGGAQKSERTLQAAPEIRRVEAAGAAGAFQFALEEPPENISRAYLVYELAGVPHWTAAVRSINGLPPLGGFAAATSSGTQLQIEEINPRWLHAGVNQILFSPAPAGQSLVDGAIPYTVRNLQVLYENGAPEPSPYLRLSHPLRGESDTAGTLLRGFVDPAAQPDGSAELFVNEAFVPHGINAADGSFSVFVPRTVPDGEAWQARIEVVYPDGTRLRQTVELTGKTHSDDGDSGDSTKIDVDDGTERLLALGDARLEVTRGAVGSKVKLTMRRLHHEELPALDGGMTNVTPLEGGFRFGPHRLRFKKPLRLSIPYDAALIPKGMTAADVRTFFFDEEAGRWVPLPRLDDGAGAAEVGVKAEGSVIVSATEHFTDFINATLAVPDEPAGANYSPNSLQQMSTADPASRIVQIAPPEAGATGDAMLEYPLVVPPGRRGMEPHLGVHYDSSGGDGWLGVGWNLPLSSVEISTLFGVPRYDGTERYTIDGEQLVATSAPGVFVRRVEGSFEQIVRRGDGPANYWWEVTDKNGTRSIYGRDARARLRDPRSANTFRWYLEQEIDMHGNSVDYSYFTDHGEDGEPWTEVYPARIDYTGTQGAGAFYHVIFTLDSGDRSDRRSSGIQGFKTFTRYRLAKVDVLAGTDLVRRYVFAYGDGDFHKSLLTSLAVTGEGGTAEFYRHTFDYTRMGTADAADGYAGFGEQQAWDGIRSSKDFTESTRGGGGAHGFVGLGPPECQPHAGAQLGGSGTDSTQNVTFLDVNGDGLPDRIDSSGRVDLNHLDAAADASLPASFGGTQFANTDTLGHTSEWTIDFGLGLHNEAGFPASVDASWVWSHANDDHLVADMDGDYRPDLVSLDGGFTVRHNNGHSFDASGWSGFAASGLQLASAAEETEVLSSFPLANPLRQLLLPYAGHVTLSGAIQKRELGGDGADVSIYRSGELLWKRRFAAGDTAPCTPAPGNACGGGLAFDVSSGDNLYFLAGSVRETSADALLWNPIVTYDGGDPQVREPYGAAVRVFDAGRDFRLAGYNGAAWSAGASGTVQVSGSLVKQETSDNVLLTVVKTHDHLPQIVFTRTFAAAEQTTFDGIPPIDVASGDLLFLRLSSRTPIDSARVQWTPTVTYQGTTNPPSLPDEIRVQHAQVAIDVPRLLPMEAQTQSWTAASTGPQNISVSCGGLLSLPAGTLYVQSVNRLLASQPIAAGSVVAAASVNASAGDPLFVTLLADGAVSSSLCSANDGSIPLNVRWPATDAASVLSGGYHNWFYGEWNGNLAFNPGRLVRPANKDDKPDYVPGLPHWDGTKGFAGPAWVGGGFDSYLAAEGTKPSRKGNNAAGVLDQASGTTPGGGLTVLRKSSGRTEGLSAAAGAGLSLSHGSSDTDLELIDMNGDHYPDQVSASGVRFSNGHDGFGPLQPFSGLDSVRSSDDGTVSLSVSLGVLYQKKNGGGKAAAIASTLPTVGSTVSFSQTTHDVIDVNGDGLPDRVTMVPGSGSVTVQLNLGYRFGAPESWTLPGLSLSGHCSDVVDYLPSQIGSVLSSLDTWNGISVTRSSALHAGVSIGPFGGGASTTLARNEVELVDINGDGLLDRVAKDEGEGFFRVQINLGDRWDVERKWYVPAWSGRASIGDGYNLGGLHCLDALSFSGHVEVEGSAGAPICIPLIVVGIQIELSAQGFGSVLDGTQLMFEDIDGDGLPDHILKKNGDGTVYVKRNQAGKVNLLSAVHRPLGSTVQISYQRRGNHPDMPMSQWVLSQVSLSDGRGTPPYVTQIRYNNDAFYDRNERENYGFGHVHITRPDGSTIDRDYKNRDFYQRHLQSKEVLADAAGNIFRVSAAQFENQPVAGLANAQFPALKTETTSFYEGTTTVEGTAPKSTARSYDYDTRGNIIRMTDMADAGSDDDVTATVTYQFNPTRPLSMEARDGAGHLLRSRRGTYDAAGNLTRLEQVLIGGRDPESGSPYTGSNNAVYTFAYDPATGNLISSTKPSGLVTTFSYDPTTRSHPTEVQDSLGYVTHFAYDLKYGDLTETTDENGNSIRRAYDSFGRLVRVVGPYDSDAAPALSFEYGPGAPISWAVVHHKDVTRPDTIDSAVFIDSLQRTIQTKDDADLDGGAGTSTRNGMRVSGRIAFDAKGRVARQGQPVFDEGPVNKPNQFVEVTAKNPTVFTYDALDRVRTVQYPHGAVTRLDYGFASFDGVDRFLTVRTDPRGRMTRFYRDVQQNIVGIEQTNTIGGVRKTLTTRYAYDALDQLTSVKDAKGNLTRLEYDTLGHNVTLDNPDLGRSEFRYDTAGNLGAKITANLAARGQRIRYLYTSGRLDRIDYPQSTDVVYTYGPAGAPFNRANRIATVSDGSGLEERSYGKLGEIVQTVKTAAALNGNTPKGPYTTKFQFDTFGSRLLSLVYPDGETLTYGYDAAGKVKSATGVLRGTRFDYLRHLGYDELGQRVRMVLGNGVETRYTYDPASRFLTQLRTTAAGRDLQNLSYQNDIAGTVLALKNDVPVPPTPLYGGPVTQTFQYDDLVQLVAAQGTYSSGPNKTSSFSLNLSYDEIGNTVTKNQVHQLTTGGGKPNPEKKTTYSSAYAYGGSQPHAPTHIGDRTFRYDADGNQTGWDSDSNGTRRTLAWDEENRLASVADNGQTTRFLYDGAGGRSNKAGPNGETIYVNRWFSIRNGAIASKHVFADSTRLATKVSPDPTPPSEKVYFYHADHCGSAQFVTDDSGAAYQHLEYFPSGEIWVDERSETQRTPYAFSGKELDDETGLSYFGARYYDARVGQWLSADSVLDGLTDVKRASNSDSSVSPFRLPGGIYAYAANDPVDLVDPEGFGDYLSLELTQDGVVEETWDVSNIMEKFPDTWKHHITDIYLKAANANYVLGEMAKLGESSFTSVSKKAKTATWQWINSQWDTSVHGAKPKSSRKALAILRSDFPDPQDVDEFVTRNTGGGTIREGWEINQGPLSSFINSTHGAAMGALGRANEDDPQEITGYEVNLVWPSKGVKRSYENWSSPQKNKKAKKSSN